MNHYRIQLLRTESSSCYQELVMNLLIRMLLSLICHCDSLTLSTICNFHGIKLLDQNFQFVFFCLNRNVRHNDFKSGWSTVKIKKIRIVNERKFREIEIYMYIFTFHEYLFPKFNRKTRRLNDFKSGWSTANKIRFANEKISCEKKATGVVGRRFAQV